MRVMAGRVSVRAPNSMRPQSRGRTRSVSRPVSSLTNGAVPKWGSSPISSAYSSTAGHGKTAAEIDANLTGRPSACEAPDAIRVCMRGVSTANGTATSATRSEEHTSELQSLAYLVCRLLLEKKKKDVKQEILNF